MNLRGTRALSDWGVYSGGMVDFDGDVVLSAAQGKTPCFFWRCYGTATATGLFKLTGEGCSYPCHLYPSGTIKARGLRNESKGKFMLNACNSSFSMKWAVGEASLTAANGSGGFYVKAPTTATLQPQADYMISAPIDSDAGSTLTISAMDA